MRFCSRHVSDEREQNARSAKVRSKSMAVFHGRWLSFSSVSANGQALFVGLFLAAPQGLSRVGADDWRVVASECCKGQGFIVASDEVR